MRELVSVIIPVFNSADCLERCILSVINQTYTALEIILIDDGSTDGSGQICDNYAAIDNRIVVVHKQNGGVSDARNEGIIHSRGTFVSFVDSDDAIHPDMIKQLYFCLKESGCKISACGRDIRDAEGQVVYDDKVESLGDVLKTEEIINSRMLTMERGFWCVVWNKLICRDLLDSIVFPVGFSSEDFYFMTLVYRECDRVATLSEKLYYYCAFRKGGLTSYTIKQWLDETVICLRLANEFASDKKYLPFTKQMIDEGLNKFKSIFWLSRTEYDLDKPFFKTRKKETSKFFRSAWSKCRKSSEEFKHCLLYYDIHFISLDVAMVIHDLANLKQKLSNKR